MPGASQEPLTAAEWKVMKIVWKHKECAARDVYEEAGREHGWAPSTTKTLLRRLAEKGCLTTQAVGNSFLYRPSKTAVPSLLGAADVLMEQVLEGTTGLVLSHMVKKSKLSAHELAELRALLDAHAQAEEAR
jgi:BlaI family penicillinase repressor